MQSNQYTKKWVLHEISSQFVNAESRADNVTHISSAILVLFIYYYIFYIFSVFILIISTFCAFCHLYNKKKSYLGWIDFYFKLSFRCIIKFKFFIHYFILALIQYTKILKDISLMILGRFLEELLTVFRVLAGTYGFHCYQRVANLRLLLKTLTCSKNLVQCPSSFAK